jgi:LEA14-like dessication related protein
MKKALFGALLFFTASPLLAISLPSMVPKPTAELKSFDIESISLRDINFIFNVEIYNPYIVELKLRDVIFTFFVEGNQFFKTSTGKGLSIKAKGRKINTFRVNVKYEDIIKIVKDYSRKDILNCRSDVKIVIPLPKIKPLPESIDFDYSVKMQLPAIKPKVSVARFRVTKPSIEDITAELKRQRKALSPDTVAGMFGDIFSGKKPASLPIDPASLDIPITVDFDIVLKNETAHRLSFSDLNYDFYIGKDKLVAGLTRSIAQRGDESVISVSNKFSSRSLSKSIMGFFNAGKGTFALKGRTMLKLPDSVKKDPLKLDFEEAGEFNAR